MQDFKEIAYGILKRNCKPMHISDLTAEVKKIRRIESQTPEKTINNACQKHDKSTRVGRGMFQAVR
jgi:DNA-directed RNA polymerase delta subunit